MGANTGKPYELLVRSIYAQILRLEGIENVEVKHDVDLTGLSGIVHQIDVLWEFKLGGIQHRVIVQAKDWATRVDQGEVLKFEAILRDIPGQPRGVIVARGGYQSGARNYAESHGIVLYELRDVQRSDFAGIILNVVLDLTAYHPDFRDFNFIVDEGWVREQGISSLQIAGMEDQLMLRTAQSEPLGSVHRVKHQMISPAFQEFEWKRCQLNFEQETYLETGNTQHPRLKLLGMYAEVQVRKTVHTVGVSYKDLFEKIFACVTGGDTYLIDSRGAVSRRS